MRGDIASHFAGKGRNPRALSAVSDRLTRNLYLESQARSQGRAISNTVMPARRCLLRHRWSSRARDASSRWVISSKAAEKGKVPPIKGEMYGICFRTSNLDLAAKTAYVVLVAANGKGAVRTFDPHTSEAYGEYAKVDEVTQKKCVILKQKC